MIHVLKTEHNYWLDSRDCCKDFEVRKNDRNFKVGDWVHLVDSISEDKAGHYVSAQIAYILDDPQFCLPGLVILGLRQKMYHAIFVYPGALS